MNNVSKRYDDLEIINNSNAVVERGDKIALIGANGKGKSTILKLIAQHEQLSEGNIEYGHNRHFVSKFANKIWYIKEHQLKEYPGDYESFNSLNLI